MGFDIVANLIGAGIALVLAGVLLLYMVRSPGGRFAAAIKKYPKRAWEHIQAESQAWVVMDSGVPGEETEGLQGPYELQMPDGSTHTFLGRAEEMDASMKRFLARLPK